MRVIVASNPVLTSAHPLASVVAALSLCLGAVVACSSAPSALFSSSGAVSSALPAGAAGSDSGIDGGSGGAAAGQVNGGTSSAGASSAGAPSNGGALDAAGSPAGGAPAGGAPAGGAPAGGGMAGGVNQPSACDGKLVVPGALIADFEDGVAGWSGYLENSPLPVDSAQPGADMTDAALRFKGGKASTSGVFHLMPCSDVSDFDGVQFWAKGKGGSMVRFLAVIPATDPTAGIGDCDPNLGKCSDHPGKLFEFGPDWELHQASFAELKQYGWGIKASFNSVINAVLWINDGPVNDFDFSIDEVTLYKAAPAP